MLIATTAVTICLLGQGIPDEAVRRQAEVYAEHLSKLTEEQARSETAKTAALEATFSRPVDPADLPAIVQSVIASRAGFATSEVHWTYAYFDERDGGLTERMTTRTSGDTVWEVNDGDENGFHRKQYTSETDTIPKEESAGPRHQLIHSGHVWKHDYWKGSPSVAGSVRPIDRNRYSHPADFAYAGLAPGWDVGYCDNALCLPADFVAGLKDMPFHTTRSGTTDVVVGSSDKYEIEWHLDHQQGGEPVFAALYANDKLLFSSTTEYQELNGRRVPLSISFFRGDNPEPEHRIDVQSASFDQPEHLKDISTDDIEFEVGTQLMAPTTVVFWDGEGLVGKDEWFELVYLYGLDRGPRLTEFFAQSEKMSVPDYLELLERERANYRERYVEKHGDEPWLVKAGKEKDEWDVYVEKFVTDHKFNEEQKKVAERVLDSAKKIRDRNERATTREVDKARKDGEYVRAGALADKIDKVRDRIFNRMLVRGMNRLADKAKPKKPSEGPPEKP